MVLFFLLIIKTSAGVITFTDVKSNSMIVTVTVDEFDLSQIKTGNEVYIRVTADGLNPRIIDGSPELPISTFNIASSSESEVKWQIIHEEYDVKDGINIIPGNFDAQRLDKVGTNNLNFIKGDVYKNDNWYPSSVMSVGENYQYKKLPFTSISISPVQYNPVTKKLKIFRKIVFKVTFNNDTQVFSKSMNVTMIKWIRNFTVNGDQLSLTNNSKRATRGVGDGAIIIVVDSMRNVAEKLARWQRMKGFDVNVISAEKWSLDDAVTEVENAYNNTDPKPGYVTIIGDVEHVPAKYENICWTDDSYGEMTDDYIMEMGVGRISADNLTQAKAIVNKIIKYESSPPQKDSFYKTSASGVNTALFGSTNYSSTRSYIKNNGFTLKEYNSWSGGSTYTSEAVSDINNGLFLLSYHGHGSANGWERPPSMWESNIKGLSNGEFLPVVLSMTCQTGSYKDDNCLAEIFLKHPNGGAVGVYAASMNTNTSENAGLYEGVVKTILPSTEKIGIYRMGDVIISAEIFNAQIYQPNSTYLRLSRFNYFGSPTTEIWVGIPKDIVADYGALKSSQTKFTISNLNITDTLINSIVTLYSLDREKIIGKKQILVNSITITVDSVFAGERVVLTVSASGYRPIIDTLLVDNIVFVSKKQVNVLDNSFSVYQSSNKLHLKIFDKKILKNLKIELYNLNGKKLFELSRENYKGQEYLIDLMGEKKSFSSGTYACKILAENYNKTLLVNFNK